MAATAAANAAQPPHSMADTDAPPGDVPCTDPKPPPAHGIKELQHCNSCSFASRQPLLIQEHLKTCERSKPLKKRSRPPVVSRNYRCKLCIYTTTHSRQFLYHQRDVHARNIPIHPCHLCDYASQYKCKLLRHQQLCHTDDKPVDETSKSNMATVRDKAAIAANLDDHLGDKENANLEDSDDDQENVLHIDVDSEVQLKIKAEPLQLQGSTQNSDSSSGSSEDGSVNGRAIDYVKSVPNSADRVLFQCSLCSFTNAQKWKVASHVRSFHMKKKIFKCPFCNFVTCRKIEYCIHKTKHSNKPVFSCSECSYKSTNQSNYERHMTNHQNPGPKKCTVCSYSSTSETAVHRHMQEYHGDGTGAEDVTLNDSMDTIEEDGMEESRESIDEPQEGATTEDSQGEESMVTEETCNDELAAEGNSQEDTIAEELVSEEPAPELCEDAADVSEEVDMMERATEYLLPPVMAATRQVEQLDMSALAGSYRCTMCSLVFPSEARLRTHLISHSAEAYHRCPLCTLKYKRASDLNRHMKRKHNIRLREYYMSEQSEPLDLCVKKPQLALYTNPWDQPLDLSVKTSPPLRPTNDGEGLKCGHCSYVAKWPSDLQRHMLVHSVEKRFRCTLCQRRYKYKFDLNMHLRKMHKVSAGRTRVPGSDLPLPPSSSASTVADSDYSEEREIPEIMSYSLEPTHTSSPALDPARSVSPVPSLSPSEDRASEEPPSPSAVSVLEHQGKYITHIKPLKAAAAEKLKKSPRQLQLSPAGKFRCEFCPYLGACRSEVDRHMRLHTGEKPYSCLFCSYKSHWKGDMKRHLTKHHVEQLQNNDDIEDIMLRTHQPEKAFDHIRTPLDPNKHVSTSAKFTPSPDPGAPHPPNMVVTSDGELMPCEMRLSPRSDHSDAPSRNVCPICQFACKDVGELQLHMEAHGDLKRFQCAHCTLRSNWTWEIRNHIQRDHPQQPLDVLILSEDEARESLDKYLQEQQKALARKVLEFSTEDGTSNQDEQGLSALVDMNAALEEEMSCQEGDLPREGRFRPYMCSECGRRSNWRWDLRKHLRNVHPHATMVTLSEEEAQRRWPPSRTSGGSNDQESEPAVSDLSGDTPSRESTPASTPLTTPENEAKYHHQVDMKRLKKFKCSMCPYRSNYRSDIGRHLKRLHISGGARVVVLDEAAAAATLQNYRDTFGHKKFVLSPARGRVVTRDSMPPMELEVVRETSPDSEDHVEEAEDHPIEAMEEDPEVDPHILKTDDVPKVVTVWKCPRCVFKDKVKQIVVSHLRTHPKIKSFKCRVCGDTSDYRNAIYRHIHMKHDSTDYKAYVIESIKYVDRLPAVPQGQQPVAEHKIFRCKLCGQTSGRKEGLQQHVSEKHMDAGDASSVIEEVPTALVPGDIKVPDLIPRRNLHSSVLNAMNRLHCDVCPYRTNKSGLLRIHKTYHKIQPNNKFKCKYCPYYVSAPRLLHQHVRLHLHEENARNDESVQRVELGSEITGLEPVANQEMAAGDGAVRKGYQCEHCPYSGRNKSDYTYHIKFHTESTSSPFKCPDCPYWAAQKRILTQHRRVHTAEYKAKLATRHSSAPNPTGNVEMSPTKSESDFESPVEIAHLKQRIITGKITSVPVTPQKFRTEDTPLPDEKQDPDVIDGYLVDRAGQLLECGSLKKLNKCHFCPFKHLRGTVLDSHEEMHMERIAKYRCVHCTYRSDKKLLLTRHVYVHSANYEPGRDEVNDVVLLEGEEEEDEESSNAEEETAAEKPATEEPVKGEEESADTPAATPAKSTPPRPLSLTNIGPHLEPGCLPSDTEFYVKYDDVTGEHVMERVDVKKWCCEKCPYASMKREHFERHAMLHGSRQKCVCEYCDYSVPNYQHLLQHKRLHLRPNPNLLSTQSIANLQRLPTLPADVAAAANFPAATEDPASQAGVHDHLALYENTAEFTEPKKMYRCDRCPYTNMRRDNLLAHLKFHLIPGPLRCTYCDYSVSKQHLLMQHIKVHFTAGSLELQPTDLKAESNSEQAVNGQPEYIDISELGTTITKPKTTDKPIHENNNNQISIEGVEYLDPEEPAAKRRKLVDGTVSVDNKESVERIYNQNKSVNIKPDGQALQSSNATDLSKNAKQLENNNSLSALDLTTPKKPSMSNGEPLWVCQYCDRHFESSPSLMKHEMQHLVGNKY